MLIRLRVMQIAVINLQKIDQRKQTTAKTNNQISIIGRMIFI
jgi:hypothetical protein